MLQHHRVEPARPPAAAGVRAELVAPLDEQVADRVAVVQLGRERAAADPRHVGLGHTDDAVDRPRADAGTGADAARDRVRRRDERIGAVVEVEVRGLRALEEDVLTRIERVVHEVDRVGDHRLEARHHAEVRVRDLVTVERQPVVDLGQHAVLLAEREVELLAEDLRVEQVLDAQADAQRLVGVRGADAALGRAELVLAEEALRDAVELLVVRHDQVRVAGDPQRRRVHALALEHVELVDEDGRVDDHAVADHRCDVLVQHTARHELEREDLALHDDGVPGVVPALVADAQDALFGEVVGEPPLALVTPLGADDHRAWHRASHTTSGPDSKTFRRGREHATAVTLSAG